MKIIMLVFCLGTAWSAQGRSLDQARRLAAQIERKWPERGSLLCTACDGEWAEGGEPVRRLELILTNVIADPRLRAIDKLAQLGELMTEHTTQLLIDHGKDEAVSPLAGKATVCAYSRPPCEVFSPKFLAEYCASSPAVK